MITCNYATIYLFITCFCIYEVKAPGSRQVDHWDEQNEDGLFITTLFVMNLNLKIIKIHTILFKKGLQR